MCFLSGLPVSDFYGIGHTSPEAMRTELYDALIKNDLSSMTAKSHSFGEDHYVNEPIFVPAPGATTEDEGVLLVLLYNGHARSSSLIVLDSQRFGEKEAEIAEFPLPAALPFTFHGFFSHP